MFRELKISDQLWQLRSRTRRQEDELVLEARRILKQEALRESSIREHLQRVEDDRAVLDEENADLLNIYNQEEIRRTALGCRLKFLESVFYKPEIPYEAVLKLKALNDEHHKELREYYVLAEPEAFTSKKVPTEALLFVRTNYDNFYLVHRWGSPFSRTRKLFYWPMRRFENLFITVLLFTLVLTLVLPTALITLDAKATYWSGYRAAAFFHLLIFDMGVTVYFAFTFALNFSSSTWNRLKDFD